VSEAAFGYAGVFMVGLFLGVLLVPIALLVWLLALRAGVAGWATALAVTAGLPLAAATTTLFRDPSGAAVMGVTVFLPVVMVYTLTLWAATRWLCPAALLEPHDQP
jgi:hypothetical protein